MPPKKDPVNRHYRRLEVIGRGKFGTVYKGLDLATKKLVAIKVLNLDTEQDEVSEVQKEIQFLSQIKSIPNVTHYYGSYLNGHNLWIVMDYCAGGSVRTLLLPGPLEEKFISVIARELLQALQFIHNNGVIDPPGHQGGKYSHQQGGPGAALRLRRGGAAHVDGVQADDNGGHAVLDGARGYHGGRHV